MMECLNKLIKAHTGEIIITALYDNRGYVLVEMNYINFRKKIHENKNNNGSVEHEGSYISFCPLNGFQTIWIHEIVLSSIMVSSTTP